MTAGHSPASAAGSRARAAAPTPCDDPRRSRANDPDRCGSRSAPRRLKSPAWVLGVTVAAARCALAAAARRRTTNGQYQSHHTHGQPRRLGRRQGETAAAITATSAGPKSQHAPPAPATLHSPSSARRSASSPRPAPRSPHRPRVPATIRRSPIARARASPPVGTAARPVPAIDFPPTRPAAGEGRLPVCAQRSSVAPAPVLRPETTAAVEWVDGRRPPSLPTGPTAATDEITQNVVHEARSFSVPLDNVVSKETRACSRRAIWESVRGTGKGIPTS